MKSIIGWLLFGIAGLFLFITRAYDPPVKIYNHTGQVLKQIKVWSDTLTPSTSNGQTIDISSAGFTSISSVGINPVLNTATIANMPIIAVKSVSTTSVVVNILTQNNAVVSILGINVLSGSPMVFDASLSGVQLAVQVIGF